MGCAFVLALSLPPPPLSLSLGEAGHAAGGTTTHTRKGSLGSDVSVTLNVTLEEAASIFP